MKITTKALVKERDNWGSIEELNPLLGTVKQGEFTVKEARQAGFICRPARPDRECWEQYQIDRHADACRRSFHIYDATARLYQYFLRLPVDGLYQEKQFNAGLGGHDCEVWREGHLRDIFDPSLDIERHPRHLIIGTKFVKVLTLKTLPERSEPDFLRPLRLVAGHYYLCLEWHQYELAEARKILKTCKDAHHDAETQMGAEKPDEEMKDAERKASVAEINEGQALLKEGARLGQMSLTAVCFGDSLQEAEATATTLAAAANGVDITLHGETRGSLAAYLATIPGNQKLNFHYLKALDLTMVDFSFIFANATGNQRNDHLRADCLIKLETEQKTSYAFNTHYGDIGHSVITGLTGSGKSFLVNTIIYSLQKYNPFVLILDWGGSYEGLVRHLGGRHTNLARGALNPFACGNDPSDIEFLTLWTRVLLEQDAEPLTLDEQLFLREDIAWLKGKGYRTIEPLNGKLPMKLRHRLDYWLARYGTWLTRSEDEARLQDLDCYDFVGLENHKNLAEPFVLDLFHRATKVIRNPEIGTKLKAIFVDEAWAFLRNPLFLDYLREFPKTLRKHQGMITFSTQSLVDVKGSDIAQVIVECCPTKLFLHNPQLDFDLYSGVFHLNKTEVEMIPKLKPKQQFLLHRPDEVKVLNLKVPDTWKALFGTSPYEIEKRRKLMEEHGNEWLEKLAVRA